MVVNALLPSPPLWRRIQGRVSSVERSSVWRFIRLDRLLRVAEFLRD